MMLSVINIQINYKITIVSIYTILKTWTLLHWRNQDFAKRGGA